MRSARAEYSLRGTGDRAREEHTFLFFARIAVTATTKRRRHRYCQSIWYRNISRARVFTNVISYAANQRTSLPTVSTLASLRSVNYT